MLEIIATGPEQHQTWRRELPQGETVRLGRAPQTGWAAPWDLRISREHADLRLQNGCLHVCCLDSARNCAYRDGAPYRELTVRVGEEFRIGSTVFRLDYPEDAPSTAEFGLRVQHPAAKAEDVRDELQTVKRELHAARQKLAEIEQQNLETARSFSAADSERRQARELCQQQAEELASLKRRLAEALAEKERTARGNAVVKSELHELLGDLQALDAAENSHQALIAERFGEFEADLNALRRDWRVAEEKYLRTIEELQRRLKNAGF